MTKEQLVVGGNVSAATISNYDISSKNDDCSMQQSTSIKDATATGLVGVVGTNISKRGSSNGGSAEIEGAWKQ